jgi:tripartite-type tricarboxylate transporter receptor subunit TctC
MRLALLSLALVATLASAPVRAADIVKLIVPFAPGGPVDQVARIMAPGLSAELGKTVVVENRGGAGGTIGVAYVAKSPADGSTVLITTSSYVLTAGTTPNLPYNSRKDLQAVALIGQVQTLLVVRPSLQVNTVAELVAKAKAGTRLSFGSTGVGSTMHIGGELLNMAAGIHALHVPYRGAAPAITDLLAGNIDMVNADMPVLQPYVKEGQVKALVIYDSKRAPELPDVPTAEEAGYPQLQMSNWYCVMTPAGTPAAIHDKLEAAVLNVVNSPDVARKLSDAGMHGPMDAKAFQAKLDADFDRWLPFLQKAGIHAQ